MKVLVAEDSLPQARRLRADLELQGFTVVVAHDGREALDAARRERPEVILSDVLMPTLDGFRLCREVRADTELRSIPVILRTNAFVEDEDRLLALESGAFGYIRKNMDGERLGSVLREAADIHSRAPDQQTVLDEHSFHGKYADRLLRRLVQEAAEIERVNESLQVTQQRLQGILDHSPMSMYLKDREGRFLLANKQLEKVTGLGSEDIVGKTDDELFGAEQGRVYRSHDLSVLESGVASDFEETFIQEDGLHTYLSTKFALTDGEGAAYALCGISVDITQRKLLEEGLRHAQKMEAVGRLAGGIAHDFNNLLSVIINFAQLASTGLDETDPRREDIHEISEAAKRGADLVKQLMTFSRGHSVPVELLQPNDLIEQMEALMRTSAGGSNALVTSLDPTLPLVTINRGHLEQIALNLVINAKDAMPRGGEIRVETARVDLERPMRVGDSRLDPGSYALIRVSDTGIGMTSETMEHIFEPFFTTKPEGTGTGLGLATVHGIVRGAGGCITIDSQPGSGTTFGIYLPAGDRLTPSMLGGQSVRTGNGAGGRTVLVVDDEPAIRQIIRRTLEQHGFDVLTATSGEEALEVYAGRDEEVHLLITDVIMPGMSGTELAERLAALNPELEVIYVSGYEGTDQGKERTLPDGATLVPKPFVADQLLAEVRSILGSESPPAASRGA